MSANMVSVLAGRRVAVTRAPDQAAELVALLRSRGAEPLPCSTIEIAEPADGYAALDAAIRSIGQYDWIAFTSQNAVRSFADRLDAQGIGIPRTVRLAAVGDATARTATNRLRSVDFVPSTASAESLATEIGDVADRRVLFPRGNLAGETLGRLLRSRGALVDEVIAYRTVPGTGVQELAGLVRSGDLDAILFMSASSVRHLVEVLGADGAATSFEPQAPVIVCVGPETARAAREGGVTVSAIAADKTAAGVVDALEQWFRREDDGKGR